jgi:hypothetical protein
MTIKKKISVILLVAFIGMQLFRPKKNDGIILPSANATAAINIPANVENILKTSCYDCHSNKTTYYWYHEIMPFGWWLDHHVEDGKKHLNFSEFATYNKKKMDHKLEETAEEVLEGNMPLNSYTIAHGNAKLSESQIKIITEWVANEREKLKQPE